MDHIHFIGIKGVGMAALAVLAKEKGYTVTGSDVRDSFPTDEVLAKAGIAVRDFDLANIAEKPDLVVISTAYGPDNLEYAEAKKRNLKIQTYSEALSELIGDKKVIAVSGIHGKTTTTALISHIFQVAGLKPGYVVGSGNVPSLGASSKSGTGEYFIVEADEYKKSQEDPKSKFLDLHPNYEIITSIEMDHPDLFSTEEEVYNAFYHFACQVPRNGFIVINYDYPKSRKLVRSIADRTFFTYGAESGDWRVNDYVETKENIEFSILHGNEKYGVFKLNLAGEGNVLNATAGIIMSLNLGISEEVIKQGLESFLGVKRRFEKIAEEKNYVIIDDYAHHPRAVTMTLETARKKYPGYKIICIFQPHTYSRTRALLSDFAQAFTAADKVIVTDIYASEREKEATITASELVENIAKYHRAVIYQKDWSEIIKEVKASNEVPAVILTIGAGDIYKIGPEIVKELNNG